MVTPKSKGMASYRRVTRNTASPGQRVVMLYDGILKCLQTAREATRDDSPCRFETVHNELQRADRIIHAMISALDFTADSLLAETLQDLYLYWIQRLSDANMNKDAAIIEEVEGLVSDMRDAWQQAAMEAMRS
mgnify:CR=1 FL=1